MDEERKKITEDLRKLNERYLELNPPRFKLANTRAELNNEHKKLIEGAQLIIDYHEKEFHPKYEKTKDETILEVGITIHHLAHMASVFIDKKNYFGLGTLLYPQGSKINDPTTLEELVKRLER